MQYFYHQHIDYDGLLTGLRLDVLDELQKEELESLINQIVHKKVIEIVLSFLPRHKHEQWLTELVSNPEGKTHWDFLKVEIKEDIQYEIKHQFAKLKREILDEVKKAKG
jgi:hypothetical protein